LERQASSDPLAVVGARWGPAGGSRTRAATAWTFSSGDPWQLQFEGLLGVPDHGLPSATVAEASLFPFLARDQRQSGAMEWHCLPKADSTPRLIIRSDAMFCAEYSFEHRLRSACLVLSFSAAAVMHALACIDGVVLIVALFMVGSCQLDRWDQLEQAGNHLRNLADGRRLNNNKVYASTETNICLPVKTILLAKVKELRGRGQILIIVRGLWLCLS